MGSVATLVARESPPDGAKATRTALYLGDCEPQSSPPAVQMVLFANANAFTLELREAVATAASLCCGFGFYGFG